MSRRRRSRATRLLARLGPALLAGGLAMMVFAPTSQATVVQSSYVSLRGEGAWSLRQEVVPWQNELSTAKSSINLDYAARGSYFGRTDFLAGGADFAVSGVPFSTAQLAAATISASDLIAAPIDVASLAVFIEPPTGGFTGITQICDPDDPSTWPPTPGFDGTNGDCVVRKGVPDPIKIPNRNVAAMLLGVPSIPGVPDLTRWNSKDILQALNVGQLDVGFQSNASPGIAGRSDPDEINYYLQQFVKTAYPAVWQANKQLKPQAKWDPISEYIPIPAGVTRDGAEQQLDQLANGGSGVGLGNSPSVQGGLAAAPPSTLQSFHSTFPGVPLGASGGLTTAALQNAEGDWVRPTPSTIDAAVAAGAETPLYALTHKVANAYPLAWVDHLYAPAHGLSIEKTEGLAMLIRYLATTGQTTTAAVGEGRLSNALVTQALKAADALVLSNCKGADREVVTSSDPGPLAPPTAKEMQSIGPMNHCVPAPGAPSTTTSTTVASPSTFPIVTPASTGGGGGSAGPSNFGSGGSSVGSGSTTGTNGGAGAAPGSSSTDGAGGTGSGSAAAQRARPSGISAVLTASKLPLPMPATGSGGDRLATFLLGAALYLVVRKPVGRLFNRINT